jgi:hypothetical protein
VVDVLTKMLGKAARKKLVEGLLGQFRDGELCLCNMQMTP